MTRGEKLKIDNFKAHHNSILGNIAQSNEEHEGILSKLKVSKELLKEIEEKTISKHKELGILLKVQEEKKTALVRQEQKLSEKTESLERYRKEILDSITTEKRLLKEEEDNQRCRLRTVSDDLKIIKQQETATLSNLENLNKEIKFKDSQKDKTERNIKFLQSKMAHCESDHSLLCQKYIKEQKILQNEIKELQDKVEKERERIETQHKSLSERERVVSIRERDALILVNRLKLTYKRILPNSVIKI